MKLNEPYLVIKKAAKKKLRNHTVHLRKMDGKLFLLYCRSWWQKAEISPGFNVHAHIVPPGTFRTGCEI